MKHKVLLLAVSCLMVAIASAQTDNSTANQSSSVLISGRYLAEFVDSTHVAKSTVFQTTQGNVGIGVFPPLFPLHVFSTNTTPPPGQSSPSVLFVETPVWSSTTNVIAIQGLASSNTGSVFGVLGTTFSPSGIAVFGNNTSPTGEGGGGVQGITNSADFGFSYATRGDATASTGSAVAIFAQTYSPDGTPGYFLNRAAGNIIVGHVGQNDDQSVFRVDGTGRVFANGGFQSNGADFAESLPVAGDRARYSPGDLLQIDPAGKRQLTLSRQPYSTLVAGVYSSKPGMLATAHAIDSPLTGMEIPLAVVGIVPCKVTAENGPIAVGDLLVTSSIPGHAMKGVDRTRLIGAVVGKALEPLDKGTGVIQVLVTLQ